MMKKKVCHVIGGIVGGGIEQVIINYCSKIETVDFDLLYQYEPNNACLTKLENAGVRCVQIPDKIKHPFSHCIAIYSFLKKAPYDAVHIHLDWFLSWIICIIALLAGVKKRIIHHHQIYQERTVFHRMFFFLMQKMNVLCSTCHLACSDGAAINGFGRRAYKNGSVVIIQNAVNVERFKFNPTERNRIRSQYGIATADVCIGCIGRFCFQKNQFFLLNAFKRLVESKANYVLMLIGNGPDKEKILEQIQKKKIKNRVLIIDPQDDVSPFYSAMDAFCLPSRWEGLGMVLVEAQINGLQCFASDKIPESVQISNNVKFLSIADASVWTNAILNTECFSRNNLFDAEMFDIDKCYKKLEKIYLE